MNDFLNIFFRFFSIGLSLLGIGYGIFYLFTASKNKNAGVLQLIAVVLSLAALTFSLCALI